jgi:hypothetical protein
MAGRMWRPVVIAASLLLATICGTDGYAQPRGGSDPWGWSRQSNQAGMQQACNAFRNEYNSIYALYQNSRNERTRREYYRHLQDIRERMAKYCS